MEIKHVDEYSLKASVCVTFDTFNTLHTFNLQILMIQQHAAPEMAFDLVATVSTVLHNKREFQMFNSYLSILHI